MTSDSTDLHHLTFWLSSFWAALYVLRHYRRRAARASFLPAPTSSTPSTSPDIYATRGTRVTLRNFHLNIESTVWNVSHQRTSTALRRSRRWRALIALAYDVGNVLGVLGMIGSVVLLAWTTFQLGIAWIDNPVSPVPSIQPTLRKRDSLPEDPPPSSEAAYSPPLQLIIPGLTTPAYHAPILLLALFVTQIIHELGHALAAALESVPLGAAGAGLTVVLPSAYVALDTDAVPPRSRMRIISAGAFHNLVLWLLLSALASARLSDAVWPLLGYRDVRAYGRVVVAVDEHSALYGHLPVGAVVYKVGDDTLDGEAGASARWDELLTKRNAVYSRPSLGWCTEEPWYAVHPSVCCTSKAPSSEVSVQACFAPIEDPSFERCLDPLLFLDAAESTLRRCTSVIDCGHGQLCVRPRGDQELVALTMHVPRWLRVDEGDIERTVVWKGDRAEILQEVEVGDWLPGYSVLPIRLPLWFETLFMYLKTLTLSLYFFNLLPLPFLDGGQLLDVLHDWWAGRSSSTSLQTVTDRRDDSDMGSSVELGELEGGPLEVPSRRGQVRRANGVMQRKRVVDVSVGALLALCVLLSLANAYRA